MRSHARNEGVVVYLSIDLILLQCKCCIHSLRRESGVGGERLQQGL